MNQFKLYTMLKKRIIATLVIKDGIVVQSVGFNKYLPIGKPEIAIEFLNQWGIDEITLIDISATLENRGPDINLIKKVSEKCFVPLTVGGGIKTVEDVRNLTQSGADKVLINSVLFSNSQVVPEMTASFGNQCIIASIDFKKNALGENCVYNYLDKVITDIDPLSFALEVENLGVGELLINSVDKDGSYLGFDIDQINKISNKLTIPIIALGGAKNATSFVELFTRTNIDSGAAGNFFHFTEHSVITTKAQLMKMKGEIRLETFTDYNENVFDLNGRILKKSDSDLEQMLFVKIEKEVI